MKLNRRYRSSGSIIRWLEFRNFRYFNGIRKHTEYSVNTDFVYPEQPSRNWDLTATVSRNKGKPSLLPLRDPHVCWNASTFPCATQARSIRPSCCRGHATHVVSPTMTVRTALTSTEATLTETDSPTGPVLILANCDCLMVSLATSQSYPSPATLTS